MCRLRVHTLALVVVVAVGIFAVIAWRRLSQRAGATTAAQPGAAAPAALAAPAPASTPAVRPPADSTPVQVPAATASIAPTSTVPAPASPSTLPQSIAPATATQGTPTDELVEPAKKVPAATASTGPADPPPVMYTEVQGTERMIDAHAPLRQPEVADPDSAGNRKIVQTMINKARMHAAEVRQSELTPPPARKP